MPCIDKSVVVRPEIPLPARADGCLDPAPREEIADGVNLIGLLPVVVESTSVVAVATLLLAISAVPEDALLKMSFLVCSDQSSIMFCNSSRWPVALFILGHLDVEKSQLLRTNISGILGHPSGKGYNTSKKTIQNCYILSTDDFIPRQG